MLGLNFPVIPVAEGTCPLPGVTPDGSYRTRWNGVCHNGLIHSNSNFTLNNAFNQRMLIERTNENGESIHQSYLDCQTSFLNSDQELFTILTTRFAVFFESWEGREAATEEHYDDPHAKRALRISGYNDRLENWGERLWLRNQRLRYKLKKDEIAKPGKAGRTIGDLGVEASLQGAWATKLDKHAVMDDILLTEGGRTTRVHFCSSPTSAELKEVFDALQFPPEDAYFVYFSDDSCYATHTPNGVWRANIDISSCDASHSDRLFTKFADMHPSGSARDDMNVLVDQCRAAIVIEAPSRHEGKKMKVALQSKSARLFSGSTLTTVINGFANACIAQAIHSSNAVTSAGIMAAARATGYVVTVDVCQEFEDIQFLKSSPVRSTNGDYLPLLNFGVLLRAFGTCKGDLPGKGSLKARGNSFQKGLLQGLYPRVHFPLLDKIKEQYSNAVACDKAYTEGEFKCTDTIGNFTDAAVFRRYFRNGIDGARLSGPDLGGLYDLTNLQFGFEHASTGADSVLRRDYGLRCW